MDREDGSDHEDTRTPRNPKTKGYEPLPPQTEFIAKEVVDAAMHVHKKLGPGLLESVYEVCLAHELKKRRIPVETQVALPIVYDGIQLDAGYRIDMLVQKCIIVELKAAEVATPLFEAQLLTYLKLTGHRLGLLINFNVPLLKDGIKRLIL